jgi:DNA-binding NtrC family response regulator
MSRLPRVLAIDDDQTWLRLFPMILEGICEVETQPTIDQGIAAISSAFYDIVILDINFENDPRNGLDLFRYIQSLDRGADVIVISGETDPERLIEIMNAGVLQFLPKPSTNEKIVAAVKSAIEKRDLRMRAWEGNLPKSDKHFLIGKSQAMEKLRAEISFVVRSGVSDILLLGETGTGKEMVARSIAHAADPIKRFVPIHCAAISDSLAEAELFGHVKGAFTGADRERAGAFEAAGGGFIFLDEIGDMPVSQQAKLLRVLQERKVQRVGSLQEIAVSFKSISATHVDLEKAISEKRFREDLFYRISKHKIALPALRDRLSDVPELAHSFLADFSNKPISITDSALGLLASYHWPGNVRQLRSAIEALAGRLEGTVIREKDIFLAIPQLGAIYGDKASKALVGRYGAAILTKERDRFVKALNEAHGNRESAARILNISRASFFRRAKELGLINSRPNRSQLEL